MTTDYYIAEQQLARTYHGIPELAWMLPDPDVSIVSVALDVDLGGDEPVDIITLSDGRVALVGWYDDSVLAYLYANLESAHCGDSPTELESV